MTLGTSSFAIAETWIDFCDVMFWENRHVLWFTPSLEPPAAAAREDKKTK
jgi:hypothetical protein